jgi:hypothetical protein
MNIFEDVYDEDVDVSPIEEIPQEDDLAPPSDPPEVELLILLNVLTRFFALQTLKLFGYIKHREFIIIIDNRNNHNFIHRCIAQEVNFYICAIKKFQVMIAIDNSMKYGGHCEKVRLQIGQYHLKYHMFAIDMGDCDIFLGVERLHTLDPILMYFKELTM